MEYSSIITFFMVMKECVSVARWCLSNRVGTAVEVSWSTTSAHEALFGIICNPSTSLTHIHYYVVSVCFLFSFTVYTVALHAAPLCRCS